MVIKPKKKLLFFLQFSTLPSFVSKTAAKASMLPKHLQENFQSYEQSNDPK